MLTEVFEQVEVIPGTAFVNTLKEGHPVMINVILSSGNINSGHEIVLITTFQHQGETWFEMIDSNQDGAQQRLYLSTQQLTTILKENGVVYRPDPGNTSILLH